MIQKPKTIATSIKKIANAFPALADDVSNGFSTAAQALVNVGNKNPFPGNRGEIKKQTMGLMHSALAMDGEISDNRNHGKSEKKEERVDWISYFFKLLSRRFQARFDRSVRHRSPRWCLLRADSLGNSRRQSTNQAEEVVRPRTPGRKAARISTGSTVTTARPVLLGRRFSRAL